jgi:hypothetical protein
MIMESMWYGKLTRENLKEFYDSTVEMAYPAVLSKTRESTRCESAIIKSYSELFSRRNNLAGDRVMFEFGDILLRNANAEIEQNPLSDDMEYVDRVLDEYTRNSMFDKITQRIDSKSFKVAEFISSDSKKKSSRQVKKINDLFPITPLLIIEVIVLAILIGLTSYAAITLPYRNNQLIKANSLFESKNLQEQFVSAMDYFPFVSFGKTQGGEEGEPTEPAETTPPEQTNPQASLAETQETTPSATSG